MNTNNIISLSQEYRNNIVHSVIVGLLLYGDEINEIYDMYNKNKSKTLFIKYKDITFFGEWKVHEIYSNMNTNVCIHNVYLRCDNPIRIYSFNITI